MTRLLVRDFVHPPLHNYLLHVWMKVFGFGQLQARLMSLAFGSLAIVMMYLLARRLFHATAGLIAALLLAVSQIAVNHSQEGRTYTLTLFLVLCAANLFVRAVWERKVRLWWAFVGAVILMMYSHYYTVFVVAALFLYGWLFRKQRPVPARQWAGGALVVFFAFVPWLLSGVLERAASATKLNAATQFMRVQWFTPVSSLNWFHNGKWAGIYPESPLWTFPVGWLLFALPVALAVAPRRREWERYLSPAAPREAAALLLLLALLPMTLGIALAGLLRIQFDVRYIAYTIGPYYVLAAYGLSCVRLSAVRGAWLAVLVLYSVAALRANYFVPYKGDYRGATAYVASAYRPGDCVCFTPGPVDEENVAYFWRVHQRERRDIQAHRLMELLKGPAGCRRVWLVWDQVWYRNPTREHYRKAKAEMDKIYELEELNHFFKIDVHLYVPRPAPRSEEPR